MIHKLLVLVIGRENVLLDIEVELIRKVLLIVSCTRYIELRTPWLTAHIWFALDFIWPWEERLRELR